MPGIADLPVELFIDNIFPFLSAHDIVNLGTTNKSLNSLSQDEVFWHRRIQEDFNFPGADTARQTGWLFLYKRLSNLQVYVWGEATRGRLGTLSPPKSGIRDGVPFPTRLDIPNARIVSLAAGGMSFHALDANGNIYVWGQLDGTSMALRSDGFSEPSQKADVPHRLQLPVKFRTISCGRLHTTAMDSMSDVWTFTSWGRPFRLSSSLVDKSSPETTPVQVESGWSFSAVLTQSGDVLVYWPFDRTIRNVIEQENAELDGTDNEHQIIAKAKPTSDNPNVIPCSWWVLHGVDPVRLPPIPVKRLPQLRRTGLSRGDMRAETKLVKIAGFDNNIIGLTNKGHVLRYNRLSHEERYQEGHWQYLPRFSDIDHIKDMEPFSRTGEGGQRSLVPPETMHITHISASFHTFFAYSTGASSVVLMGDHISDDPIPAPHNADPFVNHFSPKIIPELQNQSVISVVVGDYHYGALTATGRLLTWGAFSRGALGLGDPVTLPPGSPGAYATQAERDQNTHERWGVIRPPADVLVPAEVRFDHRERRPRAKFCFAAAALGWHTGALVVDLDDDPDEDAAQDMPGAFQPPEEPPVNDQIHTMPHDSSDLPRLGINMRRGGLPFRVGFAGRGMHRGGAPRS